MSQHLKMAINKEKNKLLQITFPKEDAEQLQCITDSFNEEGVKCTKSDILLTAFRGYVKLIVANGLSNKELEELEKEKKDA